MRTSRFPITTLKDSPKDAEVVSHQLMMRAGMIQRIAAGIYTWLPLGFRVLQKTENIVRKEMNASGAVEVIMPSVQPAELWHESGRWNAYGPELLRFKDRHNRDFCLGPTHEEVITTMMKQELKSYKSLPVNTYQIQWKFRDEIRPRYGLMRGREFLMKDAYSFDADESGMQESFNNMYETYHRVFKSLGLDAVSVAADSGSIGGNYSHEFHVLAESGEDDIAICDNCDYTANIEMVPTAAPKTNISEAKEKLEKVHTPNVKTVKDLSALVNAPTNKIIKTLFVRGENGLIAFLIRGDHQLNTVKAEKIEGVISPLAMASREEVFEATGANPGSVGPIGLETKNIKVVADLAVQSITDGICGANEDEYHYTGVNFGRDMPTPEFVDLRDAATGEPCPNCAKPLRIKQGIEVGHIFQLGDIYSKKLSATFLDKEGKQKNYQMGCYGIGVSRIVASAIEQNNDEAGIIWPDAMAPFTVAVVPIGYFKNDAVRAASDALYEKLTNLGIDVILYDKDDRPGQIFSELDLIGIPHRIVLGAKSLEKGLLEYKSRRDGRATDMEESAIIDLLSKS